MSAGLKRQRFGDSESDETEPRGSNYQRLDEHDNKEENSLDNKEGNGLDKDENEMEGGRYIPPLFDPLPLLLWKLSNRPSDLSKGTKSLKYIIYIPKICYLKSANFALKFSGGGGSKAQKKTYTSCLKKGLESHSTSTASTTSGTTNYCCLIREHLESHPHSNYHQDLGT